MPQSFDAIYLHIIFSTKHREAMILPVFQARMFSYMGGILSRRKCVLMDAGGMADHVHLLVALPRDMAVADAVRDAKSVSSGWIHETFPASRDFAWQSGYAAFSVSFSGIGTVKTYIARQEEHHRVKTFQEEYREFLMRHEVPFDERYMWD